MKALLQFLVPAWLLFGLGFDSESSTTSTTWQQDNRRTMGEGSISAENSDVRYTVNSLAPEVIDGSLNFANNTVDSSLSFAGDTVATSGNVLTRAVDNVLTFAGDTLDRTLNTTDRTTDTAFSFGGDALSGALQFGELAMTNVTNIADSSIEASAANARASAKTAQSAIDTASDTFGSALQFGAGTIAKAFDQVSETGAFVKDAYADAKGRGALTDKILIGALIAMAVVAIYAGRKG